jgi:hypothetical protein
MRYLLVLQFPGRTLEDFDWLVELEDSITQKLDGLIEYDGHDFGSGTGNIFVGANEPERAWKAIKDLLDVNLLADLHAAFRDKEASEYTILWPPDLKSFAVI